MKSRSDEESDQAKTFSASSSSSGTLAIEVAEAEHTNAQFPNTGESADSKEAEPNQRSKKDKTHIQDHISEGNVREPKRKKKKKTSVFEEMMAEFGP